MKPIIKVNNLGKQYRIGLLKSPYSTLRESLVGALKAPFRKVAGRGRASSDFVWALKDVTFEVPAGQVVGVIGRNGAGKSTLLKVLSRITEPTRGRIELYGRVGSLLEVGTGFHPELTGRENIYLNGAVLGMRRTEIQSKFDEIVAFAEVEKFLDTPVKRYSSGMYMRLAFAVAAHLEPEILLVDEVLAVGDDAFQKKCLGKMAQISGEGRTVLFVSHNMPAVMSLCPRVIMLEGGKVARDGDPADVVGYYLNSGEGMSASRRWPEISEAPGDDVVRLRAVSIVDEDGQVCPSVDITRKVGIRFEYDILRPGQTLIPTFGISTDTGTLVFLASDTEPEWESTPRPAGHFVSTAWIPGNLLNAGTLMVDVTMTRLRPKHKHLHEHGVISFQVVDKMGPGTARGNFTGSFPGAIRPLLPWETHFSPGQSKDAEMEAVSQGQP